MKPSAAASWLKRSGMRRIASFPMRNTGISDPAWCSGAAIAEESVTPFQAPARSQRARRVGLNTEQFLCRIPAPKLARAAPRLKIWRRLSHPTTLVLYEAPHRIVESLADIEAVWVRPVACPRPRATKLHEEFLRGTVRKFAISWRRETASA